MAINPSELKERVKECRLERGLTQDQLARLAEVPYTTLTKIECGAIKNPSLKIMSRLAQALDTSVDDFTRIETYRGNNAVRSIWSDILSSLKKGDTMYISGIDERRYLEADRGGILKFIAEIKDKGLTQKLISCEGDTTRLAGDHLEYKWIPEAYFSPTPIYVYADKIATLNWGPPQSAMIMRNKHVAEAYRKQFLLIWEKASSISGREA